ncbi:hypothetical protein KM043_017844 [Ampulex compressa]|nr:hypothetical protein KM043_017844 [Ampulex compressa]
MRVKINLRHLCLERCLRVNARIICGYEKAAVAGRRGWVPGCIDASCDSSSSYDHPIGDNLAVSVQICEVF